MITKIDVNIMESFPISITVVNEWDKESIRDAVSINLSGMVYGPKIKELEDDSMKRKFMIIKSDKEPNLRLISNFKSMNQRYLSMMAFELSIELLNSIPAAGYSHKEILVEISQRIYDQWMFWVETIVKDSYLSFGGEE